MPERSEDVTATEGGRVRKYGPMVIREGECDGMPWALLAVYRCAMPTDTCPICGYYPRDAGDRCGGCASFAPVDACLHPDAQEVFAITDARPSHRYCRWCMTYFQLDPDRPWPAFAYSNPAPLDDDGGPVEPKATESYVVGSADDPHRVRVKAQWRRCWWRRWRDRWRLWRLRRG